MNIIRQVVFPLPDEFSESRFGQSGNHYAFVEYVFEIVVGLDVLHHLRQGAEGFEWDTRHRIQGGRMPESFLREAENHDGSRSLAVYYDIAGVRNHCLGLVGIQDIQASGGEDPVNDLQLLLMFHVSLAAGHLGEGSLGDVVPGGAEATGGDDYVIDFQFMGKIPDNLVMVIPDG